MEVSEMKNLNSTIDLLPPTINIHLTRLCNFKCGYCYAAFSEIDSKNLPFEELSLIIQMIAEAPASHGSLRKVNFAGGEPLLYPHILEAIHLSKKLGLQTSLVTNGSLLTERSIAQLQGRLDILALSIDSSVSKTNGTIGRASAKVTPDNKFYKALAEKIHDAGIRLKVNTVVNRWNLQQNVGQFVATLRPFRWKLFQVKEVIGQNDSSFSNFSVTEKEFLEFASRNKDAMPPDILVVPETAEMMIASYAMIGPNGCFFDDSLKQHRYSQPIIQVGLMNAFQQVQFSVKKFLDRGGWYV
jgi:radical S-adenosyl methionine domain-containing protein 2